MGADNFHVSRRNVTSITPLDTREIHLRVIDWRRIYRRVGSMEVSLGGRELFAGLSWGITTSCVLSLIPLYQAAQQIDPWVKPAFWICAVASAVIGLIIWFTMKDSSQDISTTKNEILKDMKEIHCLYFPDEDLGSVYVEARNPPNGDNIHSLR